MRPPSFLRWAPLVALGLLSCSDGSPVALAEEGPFEGEEPLVAVLPDLAPEPGTVGTERYVPVLERVLRRSVGVIRDRQGEEAADRVVAEARRLHEAVRAARESGDAPAVREAVRSLERFQARVGLRVFGLGLVRHVHGDAAAKLQAFRVRLKEAAAAGQDVSRFASAAREVRRLLEAARAAAGKDQPAVALVHAAHALDLVTRIAAAL